MNVKTFIIIVIPYETNMNKPFLKSEIPGY